MNLLVKTKSFFFNKGNCEEQTHLININNWYSVVKSFSEFVLLKVHNIYIFFFKKKPPSISTSYLKQRLLCVSTTMKSLRTN